MFMPNKIYSDTSELPQNIPIFPLTGALLLPRGQLPLNIFEPRYLEMIDEAIRTDRLIGMIQPSLSQQGDDTNNLCKVGCAGRIISLSETGDGRYLITLFGICRFEVQHELETDKPFRSVHPDWAPYGSDLNTDSSSKEVNREELIMTLRSYLKANDMDADWDGIENTETEVLVNALSMMSPYGPAEKQALLEAQSLKSRAETLVALTEFSLANNGQEGNGIVQ